MPINFNKKIKNYGIFIINIMASFLAAVDIYRL